MNIIPEAIKDSGANKAYVLLVLRIIVVGSFVVFSIWGISDKGYGIWAHFVATIILLMLFYSVSDTFKDFKKLMNFDKSVNAGVVWKRELHVSVFIVGFVSLVSAVMYLIAESPWR